MYSLSLPKRQNILLYSNYTNCFTTSKVVTILLWSGGTWIGNRIVIYCIVLYTAFRGYQNEKL